MTQGLYLRYMSVTVERTHGLKENSTKKSQLHLLQPKIEIFEI